MEHIRASAMAASPGLTHMIKNNYTTKEVEEKTGITASNLLFWQREGKVNPETRGVGTGKRLSWSDEDIAQVMRLKNGLGDDEYFAKAAEVRENMMIRDGSKVVACGAKGARIVDRNDTIREVEQRVGKRFVVKI